MKVIGFILLLFFLSLTHISNEKLIELDFKIIKKDPEFLQQADDKWVDSVFNTLSEDEKIAQLLMIPVYTNKDNNYYKKLFEQISNHRPGGIIFMQGGPLMQVKVLNKIQQISRVPVIVAMDAEWSLGMRLDSVIIYPRQMLLGAIQDNNLIYEMSIEFARQLKRVGVNINFAPVCDINSNPENPVINSRSFGENKYTVAYKSYFYMKGMQDNKIIATAKHFPGHGDTNLDSHKTLPTLNHNYNRIDSVELFPFKYLIDNGCAGVMTAHLHVPAIDGKSKLPASLSSKVITKLLKNELNFRGIIFTDALNMGGVSNYYKFGDAEVMALIAGNDVLLFVEDMKLAIDNIKKAIIDGKISMTEIDSKCKKILKAKYWTGLNSFNFISEENLYEDINNINAKLIQRKLYENGLTLLNNKDSIIPINFDKYKKIAVLITGESDTNVFSNRIKYYINSDDFVFEKLKQKVDKGKLLDSLSKYDIVIVSVQKTNYFVKSKYGISEETISFIDSLAGRTNIILDLFAIPYSLSYFKNKSKFNAIIVSYDDTDLSRDLSAQLIFGGIAARGRLPVSVGEFSEGTGIDTKKIRFKYTDLPEEAGVDSKILYKIDSIVEEGIRAGAFPGAQIVAARNGIVFFCKSFGYHTYDSLTKVKDFDLYDLASVTKVTATVPALMKLYDEKKYSLDDKLSKHLDFLVNSNKNNFIIRDILTHSSGFKSWIPFYKETIKNDSIRKLYYKTKKENGYSIKVAEDLYLLDSFRDSIYDMILISEINQKGKYVYSDLGFYLFPKFVEKLSGKSFLDYVYDNFYFKLGCWTTTYNPTEKFNKSCIVPTENDLSFRLQQLHGYVHDQGCAMLGGVSGHAGLFSSANDIAKIMQVFLNNGKYGGINFFSEKTVTLFTSYQTDSTKNRRGLGWDKPLPNDRTKGLGSESASFKAYGHSGYTGTMVWADPHYGICFVFNSNRVYQDAENWKIIKMNIRTDIEEILYQSVLNMNKNLYLYTKELKNEK